MRTAMTVKSSQLIHGLGIHLFICFEEKLYKIMTSEMKSILDLSKGIKAKQKLI